jgi:hypothetical protein
MRRFFLGPVSIVILIAFISACGEYPGLFNDSGVDKDIRIKTISSGSIIRDFESVPVGVHFGLNISSDIEQPDRMTIELFSADGELLAESAVESDFQDDLPPIELPDLDEGLYNLHFTLYSGESIIAEEEVRFFAVSEDYEILGISSYPPSFEPGSSVLLEALISSPVNSDPFLRWTIGDILIDEGFLSEGKARLVWTSPRDVGVYFLKLELFPFGPQAEISFDFSSSLYLGTNLFVTRNLTLGEFDLAPQNSYYSLFHFLGNIKDSGVRIELREIQEEDVTSTGIPELMMEENLFGYHLDGSSGFRVEDVIIPFQGTVLQPFSISMRFLLDGEQIEQNIFRSESDDGSFGFSLSFNELSELTAEIYTDSVAEPVQITAAGSYIEPYVPHVISLSISPEANGTTFFWFQDGILIEALEVPEVLIPEDQGGSEVAEDIDLLKDFVPSAMSGFSVLGGEPGFDEMHGFSGIIDEFGVYFRDSNNRPAIDAEVYKTAMEDEHGGDLVYAESFDGLFFPEAIKIGPDGDSKRDPYTRLGSLILPAGTSVIFDPFPMENGELDISFGLDLSGADLFKTIEFSVNDNKPFFTVGLDEITDALSEEDLTNLNEENPLYFHIIRTKSGTTLEYADLSYDFPLVIKDGSGIGVKLRNVFGSSSSLRLTNLLVVKNSEEEEEIDSFSEIEGDFGILTEADEDFLAEVETPLDTEITEETPISDEDPLKIEDSIIADEDRIEEEVLPEDDSTLSEETSSPETLLNEDNVLEDSGFVLEEQVFSDEIISEE